MMKLNYFILIIVSLILLTGCMSQEIDAEKFSNNSEQTLKDQSNPELDTEANLVESIDGVVYETWGKKLTEKPITLKIFAVQDGNTGVEADAPFWQEMQKMTGVTVVGTHNPNLDGQSDLNIHAYYGLKSDIVSVANIAEEMNFIAADGLFLDLNAYLDYMPNLRAFIETDLGKRVYEMSLTESGEFYMIPAVEIFTHTHIPMIRQDWLDELGLPIPQTTDDLHEALKAFKENDLGDGITVPFVTKPWALKQNAPVLWGARTETRTTGRMVNNPDGTYYHGWSTNEFRYMLTEMSKWYDEGLIASNVFSVDDPLGDHFPTNQGGFTYWMKSALELNNKPGMPEDFRLVGMLPTEFNGQRLDQRASHFIRKGRVGISAESKHPEVAAMFLDALLSKEGAISQEEGFVGKDIIYFKTTADGVDLYKRTPEFEEEYLNNPSYASRDEALLAYGAIEIGLSTHAYWDSVRVINAYEERFIEQTSDLDKLYMASYKDGTLTFIPAETRSFSLEEWREINEIKTNLEGYQDLVFKQAIMESYEKLDDAWWENYLNECKRLGMERLVEIYNGK